MPIGYWISALLALVVVLGLAIYLRKRQKAKEKAYLEALAAPVEKRVWGKQVAIPSQGYVCQAVREIANVQFKKHEAPHLPLHECTHKFGCQCKYQLLEDKRSGKERREGVDRRPVVRYAPDVLPRRSGRDRRKENNTAFNDRAI